MKKYFIVCLAAATIFACNSSSESKPGESETAEKPAETADITANPDYQKGLDLVAKSDCFTCHQPTEKVTGPAYQDVAAKYAGMPDTIIAHLANKIIAGGSGVWGEVPMLAHPDLSKEDAEAMVKYILLLKP